MNVETKEGSPPVNLRMPNGQDVPLAGDDGVLAMMAEGSEMGLGMSPQGVDMSISFFQDMAEDDFMFIEQDCECASGGGGSTSVR
jgi:hypothetical protein